MSNGEGATKQEDSNKKGVAGTPPDDGTAKAGSGGGSGTPPPGDPKPEDK